MILANQTRTSSSTRGMMVFGKEGVILGRTQNWRGKKTISVKKVMCAVSPFITMKRFLFLIQLFV